MKLLIFGLVALLGTAPAARAAPSQCPGIEGSPPGVPLQGTSVECESSSCASGSGSFLSDIALQLCNIGIIPAECGRCECCRRPGFDIFSGTALDLVGPDPANYCRIGGRGQAMGEAALCLLRDLAQAARPPSSGGAGIELERSASLGVGDVSVRQHVGFLDFDLPGRRMRGFHSVSVCAPVLGCVSNQTQTFTATLQRKAGQGVVECGDYRASNLPWVLRVDTEQLEHNVGVDIGPVSIFTPVGPFEIKPRFNYEVNLEAVTAPWAAGAGTTRRNGSCFGSEEYNVVDPDGGLFATALAAMHDFQGFGWNAVLGLGGRDPDPAGMIWSPPPGNFPLRPDFDFSIARKGDEKRPTGRFLTGLDVSYGISSLASRLAIPPLSLRKAEAFVHSNLDAAFVSQFALAIDEGKSNEPPDCHPESLTTVRMQSAIDALAEISVQAGLDIDFVLDLGFFDKHFRFHPTVNVINPTVVSSSPVIGPSALAEINVNPPPSSPEAYRSTFESFSAGMEDGRAFVDACLAEPPPAPQEPPEPSYDPGDPTDIVEMQEFPCNICLYFPSMVTEACVPKQELVDTGVIPEDYVCDLSINGLPCDDPNCENRPVDPPQSVNLKQVLFPNSQGSLPTDKRWLCDAFEKFGCFDLCSYDPNAVQPLTLTQSAVDRIGTRCRDATGGGDPSPEGRVCDMDSDCDDGNPCTEDLCVVAGEFGQCRITASDGPCDDGLFCDGADTCALGICGAHAGNPCAATAACCDEEADACPATCPSTPCADKDEGDPCDDGTACTENDGCVSTIAGLLCRGELALACPSGPCTAGLCEDVNGQPQCAVVQSGACPPDCGDGVVDPDEECDGAADAACPGECLFDCRCPPPRQRNGEPCTDPSECTSFNCADGVCCDTPCDGPLEQCNLPGQEGSCTTLIAPVPALSAAAVLAGLAALLAVAWKTWERPE
jgi:hypothetical protein